MVTAWLIHVFNSFETTTELCMCSVLVHVCLVIFLSLVFLDRLVHSISIKWLRSHRACQNPRCAVWKATTLPLYMDDSKLYAGSEWDIEPLIHLTRIYSECIRRSFRLEKCSCMVAKRRKVRWKKSYWLEKAGLMDSTGALFMATQE